MGGGGGGGLTVLAFLLIFALFLFFLSASNHSLCYSLVRLNLVRELFSLIRLISAYIRNL